MADNDGDSFVEVTSTGWFSRLGQSLVGVLIGLIGIVGAIVLLYWNEGRAVDAATALQEGAGAVISVAADQVDPGREGKLVHVIGDAAATGPARDQALGVSAPDVLRLRRVVEMYQWKESQQSQTSNDLGGGQTTRTVYNYNKTWSDTPIASDQFRIPGGHSNPSMALRGATFDAPGIRLGAFRLSPALVDELGTFQSFIPDAAGPGQRGFRPVDEGFYRGADPTNPQVGDVRLRFEAVNAQQVSVVAGQVGGMLTPFAASNGYEISLIAPGARPAAALFKEAREGEALLTWVLRAAGFVVMVISLSLLFQPLAVLVSVLPFLGSLVEGGAFLVSVALSIPLTLITIAIAWFAHRPLLAGALIISGLVVTLLMAWSKRRKAAAAS